ncbi:ATP-dependent DNA ligase [Fredinandcohnia sp. FSL W7-1320]|uniref:ATP-dependent DNA ligase n=1 Tax=Fredinandcohnia sp. FSL W7-1320 TaxID=2954540 RepID=UPI0030FD4409
MNIKPIVPFEPTSSIDIPQGSNWIGQIKWDGVRVLTYFDGKTVCLYNRKLNERTKHFPEITNAKSYCNARSVILDGEVISLDIKGNASFREVMKRDGIRKMDRVKQVMKDVPIYYMIFDVIFLNGEWINQYPLKDRVNILSNIIEPTENIHIVPSVEDSKTLYKVIEEHNMEGIVVKNLDSKYIIGGKDSNWRKIKSFKDLIAVVGGVTFRDGIVNSLLLGLYNHEKRFIYIGHAGTGKLSSSDWKDITTITNKISTNESPFFNRPERIKNTQWVEPLLTVKIQYIEWPEGRHIRQPSIQAFVDISPQDCNFNQIEGS